MENEKVTVGVLWFTACGGPIKVKERTGTMPGEPGEGHRDPDGGKTL